MTRFASSVGNGIARNVKVPDRGGLLTVYYCRPAGNDATGDGSLANPWQTLEHALEQLPVFLANERFRIDITGCTEAHAGGMWVPPFITSRFPGYDYGTWYVYSGNVEVYAEPQLVLNIPGANIVGQALDPVTGMLTITTNLAMVPGAYRGKLIFGSGVFEFCVIDNNDVTHLYVPFYATMTAPLDIKDYGAEITNSDAASTEGALSAYDCAAMLVFVGIKFTEANSSAYAQALHLQYHRLGAICIACWLGGAYLTDCDLFVAFACNINGNDGNNGLLTYGRTNLQLQCSLMVNGKPTFHGGGRAGENSYCWMLVVDGCDQIGGGGSSLYAYAALDLENCWIKNARPGLPAYDCESNGKAHIWNTKFTDNGGDAISVYNVGKLELVNVHGAGNLGLGLRIANGPQVQVSGVDVTGAAGDFKVGGNVIGTWGGFAGNEVDANSLSRMFT